MPNKLKTGINSGIFGRTSEWWAMVARASLPGTSPDELTRAAEMDDAYIRAQVLENPSCPPLVRLWLQSGQYGGMSLKDFLGGACPIK
jgi:hypothetical protein